MINRNLRTLKCKYLLKRLFDVVASFIGIIVLSPVEIFVAIGVKCSSEGPILFKQERVGLNGKHFVLLKYRSMYVNHDSETTWSQTNDIRRTVFGKFIRKYSIDELPQLFNVLKGDMSIVGPRPEIPYFFNIFECKIENYSERISVRPGMTGLAQIKGFRGDTSIEKRIEADLEYIANWSLSLDIKILVSTIFGGLKNNEK